MHNQNNDILLLLKEIKEGQQEIKRRLNSQDIDIDNLKIAISDSGKYTINQIFKAFAVVIPTVVFIFGLLKDYFRMMVIGN